MAYLTGDRVASLADHLESCIDLKHAALRTILGQRRADPAEVSRLIADIGRLANEFSCAVDVERRLRRLQISARSSTPPATAAPRH